MRLLPEIRQRLRLGFQKVNREDTMDQPLKGPGPSALEDAFHAMFDRSRSEPAPTCEQRLDRLQRLRAAVAENEARFDQAISADFGHRSSVETTIAETLFLFTE